MKGFFRSTVKVAAAVATLSAIGAPAMAHDWHDRDRYDHGDRYSRNDRYDDDVRLRGPGVDDLDPWLRNAKGGREFVVEVLGTNRVSDRAAWYVNRQLAEKRDRDHHWDRGDRYSDRRR